MFMNTINTSQKRMIQLLFSMDLKILLLHSLCIFMRLYFFICMKFNLIQFQGDTFGSVSIIFKKFLEFLECTVYEVKPRLH